MKTFLETPNLVKIGQILDTLHADLSVFYCYWLNKYTIKSFFATLIIIFVLLTATWSATIHTETIVVFPSRKWLRKRAKVLPQKYVIFRFQGSPTSTTHIKHL